MIPPTIEEATADVVRALDAAHIPGAKSYVEAVIREQIALDREVRPPTFTEILVRWASQIILEADDRGVKKHDPRAWMLLHKRWREAGETVSRNSATS